MTTSDMHPLDHLHPDNLNRIDDFLSGLTPDQLDKFDQLYGGSPPTPIAAPPPLPAQGVGSRIVSAFSGLENQPQAAPHSFLEGLAGGAVRGLGSAGTRAEAARATLEQKLAIQQANVNAENQRATAEYRATKAAGRKELAGKLVEQAFKEPTTTAVTQQEIDAAAAGSAMSRMKPGSYPSESVVRIRTEKPPETPAEMQAASRAKALGEAQGKAAGPQAPDESVLTGDAIDAMVSGYLGGAGAPSFGMGKAGVANKTRFYNRLGEIVKDGNVDIPTRIAASKAERDNLNKLTTTGGALGAFGSTVEANLGLLEPTLKQLPDVGLPVVNMLARPLATGLGNKNMAAFNAARQTVTNEFAKIINNPSLSANGVLTDTARKEMETIIDPNATVGQIRTAIKTLRAEFRNRSAAYKDALSQSQGRIKQLGSIPGATESRARSSLDSIYGGQ